ncbi:MAG: hypothetical protein ACRYHQ_04075 [Janthinobacterium lividum]
MTTMTQADFARSHGVSRSAVTQWKERGFIVLSGELIDVEASDTILKNRRQGRFNTRKPTGQRRELNESPRKAVPQLNARVPVAPLTTQLAAEVSDAPHPPMGPWENQALLSHHTGYPSEVVASAGTIETGGFVLASLLFANGAERHDVERFVDDWVARTRHAEANGFDEDDDFAPPFGCESWKQAQPFVRPWMAEAKTTWDEVEQDMADLRAAAAGAPGAHA